MAIENVVTELSDGRCGDITYMSASPFEIHHILLKMEETPKHPVSGHLFLPPNTEFLPMEVTNLQFLLLRSRFNRCFPVAPVPPIIIALKLLS